jgi:DNA-binding transcriptional regulator YhcF (GntR family)
MLYSLNREKQPMRDAAQSGHELQGDLLSILRDLPNVTSVYEEALESPDYGIDFVVNASVNGKPVRLLVQTKSALFPRDVRAAFWNLKSASTRPLPGAANVPAIPMIAAGTISNGAKELLQTERIGYLDGAGSLFLPNEDFYILIDKPSAKRARKIDRPLFSGNRSAVIHALLMNPQQWFSTTELARLVSISPSTVSVVFAELEKRDLVTAQGKGPNKTRRLANPTALLDEWVKQTELQPKPEIRRYYVPRIKSEDLMKAIDQVCRRLDTAYVITHEWAAQLYSPFLSSISQVKCRIFPNAPLSTIAGEVNAREVEEGSNWALLESQSMRDFLFEQEIRGLRVESPILAYLDLLGGEGRSKELAEHLRVERIGF